MQFNFAGQNNNDGDISVLGQIQEQQAAAMRCVKKMQEEVVSYKATIEGLQSQRAELQKATLLLHDKATRDAVTITTTERKLAIVAKTLDAQERTTEKLRGQITLYGDACSTLQRRVQELEGEERRKEEELRCLLEAHDSEVHTLNQTIVDLRYSHRLFQDQNQALEAHIDNLLGTVHRVREINHTLREENLSVHRQLHEANMRAILVDATRIANESADALSQLTSQEGEAERGGTTDDEAIVRPPQ